MSGDTDGAVLDGTNLTFQVCGAARSIAVSIDEVKPHLVVASAHGTPTPAVGEHLYSSDAEVTVSVEAPAAVDGVRAICTGWTGTADGTQGHDLLHGHRQPSGRRSPHGLQGLHRRTHPARSR